MGSEVMKFALHPQSSGTNVPVGNTRAANAVAGLQCSRVMITRLAVILGLFTATVPATKIPSIARHPDGDASLVQKYAEYNRLWFDSKLPSKNIEIGWGDSTGTYFTNYEGEGFRARISIISKVQGYDNRVCMEVLHEMVHVKLAVGDRNLFGKDSGPVHDAAFQQAMLSLAEKGAFATCW